MSREIKFRVWDKYDKKIKFPNGGDLIGYHGPSNWMDCYEVMQYTGLKDKNGKDIYEGDICKCESDGWIYGNVTPIEFFNGSFCAQIEYDMQLVPIGEMTKVYNPLNYPKDQDKCTWINDFEVIGNIYENPELLSSISCSSSESKVS